MKKVLWFAFFIILLFSGCASQSSGEWASYAPDAAKRLTIYTSQKEEVYLPLITEFEKRTGIWVSVETDSTLNLLKRIEAEKESPVCDLLLGGSVDSLEACKQLFLPYESPNSDDIIEDIRCEDHTWTPISTIPMVLIYNPKLVRNNPPADWNCLSDPVWQGEIAFSNPEVSSFSYTILSSLLQQQPEQENVLQNFYNNLEGNILESYSQIISEVANGNCCIGIELEANALTGIQNGYDLAMVYPENGTVITHEGAAIIAGCTHEDNAKLFLDFLLSEDAQNYLQETCARRSVFKAPEDVLQLPYDISWAAAHQRDILDSWHSLSGEVAQ